MLPKHLACAWMSYPRPQSIPGALTVPALIQMACAGRAHRPAAKSLSGLGLATRHAQQLLEQQRYTNVARSSRGDLETGGPTPGLGLSSPYGPLRRVALPLRPNKPPCRRGECGTQAGGQTRPSICCGSAVLGKPVCGNLPARCDVPPHNGLRYRPQTLRPRS